MNIRKNEAMICTHMKCSQDILPTLDAEQCDSIGQVWDYAACVCAVCTWSMSRRTQRSPVTVVTSEDRSRRLGDRGERETSCSVVF